MDVTEYLPMFLAESREHLQELSLAVVRIEERPDDSETVDEIFRVAHSMKGMSATMGFAAMAALAHRMEDVFELLRQRKDGLSRQAIDVLLECLDTLEATVDRIEADGEEGLDPEPLIARLQGLVRDGEARPEGATTARVVLVDDVQMPAVRAYMAFTAATQHGEVLASEPAEGDLDDFCGRELLLEVDTTSPEALAAALRAVPDVASVEVEGSPAVAPARAPAAPAAAPAVVPAGSALGLTVRLADDVQMASVRALQVLTAARAHGELVASRPSEAEVPAFDGRMVELEVATGDAVALEAAVRAVPDVAAVEARVPKPPAKASPGPGGGGHQRKAAAGTVRVDAERLDQLMHHMAELVVQRTHVEALAAQADVPGLAQAMQELTRCSHALQTMVMQVRMIPVEAVFVRFPRLVRDLSTKLDKDVELVLTGQDTELDRTVVDAIGDPLVHLVRNSLDHGIEPPEQRVANGKPHRATLEIGARHAGGSVAITVRDDGRGIDAERVAATAVKRGVISAAEAEGIDTARAIELLFAPGFSTAETTSDISGRGVGMDAVRTKVRELGGDVLMTSEPGQGTTVEIRLPLTLAIMAALLVRAGGESFAVPIDRIDRTVRLDDRTVHSVSGQRVIVVDGEVIPIVDAGAVLAGRPQDASSPADRAVLLRGQTGRAVALLVSALVGQRELVARPLPGSLATGTPVSGAAVLSDGEIALIVDCDALITDQDRAEVPVPTTA